MRKYIPTNLKVAGIIGATLVALYALTPKYTTEDQIRYHFDSSEGNHIVSVENGLNAEDLVFDTEGNLIETQSKTSSWLRASERVTDRRLSDVVEETNKDFPIGATFQKMQNTARARQAELGGAIK